MNSHETCACCEQPGAECRLTLTGTARRELPKREWRTVSVHRVCGQVLKGHMPTASFVLANGAK